MSSATERLRELLDERGVPWKDYGYENHTWWGEWHAEDRPSVNGLFLKVEGVVTPEQAIAATLGAGQAADEWGEGFRAGCDAANGASRESVEHYKAENAKLRELVAELYQCSRQYGCDRCGYKDGCSMFDRMRELGVEVDG